MDPSELHATAQIIAGLVGLIAALAPVLSRFAHRLSPLFLSLPGVYLLVGEVSSLGAFLAAMLYRHHLHLLFPFWTWLVGSLVAIVAFVLLATRWKFVTWWAILLSIVSYGLGIGFFIFGISIASANLVIFRPLEGDVLTEADQAVGKCRVYWLGEEDGDLALTKTDRRGFFRFLLTHVEAIRSVELRVGENVQESDNWRVIDWDPTKSRRYRSEIRLREEKICL